MGKPRPALQFGEPDNGRVVPAGIGQTLELRLDENPTAGFRWRLARAEDPVWSLLEDFFEPGGRTPGRPGVHCWRFGILAAGAGTIDLVYSRAWETESAAGCHFSLRLQVGA